MNRIPVTLAMLVVPAVLMVSGSLLAQEPPPRPDKYFVPFSAPQNVIDHARFFKEEAIKVGREAGFPLEPTTRPF